MLWGRTSETSNEDWTLVTFAGNSEIHWPILKVNVTLSIRGEWNRMNIGSFLMRPKVQKYLTALSTCVTL
jgi:hypothetical protein